MNENIKRVHAPEAFNKPLLGPMQAVVLRMLLDLGPNAAGSYVVQVLEELANLRLDHGQVYNSMSKLEEDGMIEFSHQVKPVGRVGPPQKIYVVTDKGREALQEARAHFAAVLDFIS